MIFQRRLLASLLVFLGDLIYAAPQSAPIPLTAIKNIENSNIVADELLLQAMSLIGIAYKFGGSTPFHGLDCSGFIQYIFKESLRLNMPRTAAEQARIGIPVKQQELQAGDLIFFSIKNQTNSHVGLYLGDNKFIHAPRTGKNIEVSSLKSSYWAKHYSGARRIIYDKTTLDIITTDSTNEDPVAIKSSSKSKKMDKKRKNMPTSKKNKSKKRKKIR